MKREKLYDLIEKALKNDSEENNYHIDEIKEYLKKNCNKQFDENSITDSKKFTEICDRLIEDADRRGKGDFYTPTVWVDKAHEMISEQYGVDWRENYIVWDCCCGTKNLTRDYSFKRLYSSSIEDGDIELSKRYNKYIGTNDGVAFQYDFLNDDVELFDELLEKVKTGYILTEDDFKNDKYCKLSRAGMGLVSALLQDKPLLFLINPPYATTGNKNTKLIGEKPKKGISKTKINEVMVREKMGSCSQELFAQFIFRIVQIKELFNLTNIKICLFSKCKLMTSKSFINLRKIFLEGFKYDCGIMFNASEFADCSDAWPIFYTMWSSCKCHNENKNKFFTEIYTREKNGLSINKIGEKKVYNLDNKTPCTEWYKIQDKESYSGLQLASGLRWWGDDKNGKGKLVADAFGYYHISSNVVGENGTELYLLSSSAGHAHGVSVTKENLSKVCANFTARKLIVPPYANWINDKDEYMIPNIEHPLYKQFENDSIVYSLFNSASNQTSLRNINSKGKIWNIKNEWFFMSEAEMSDLASGITDEDTLWDKVEDDIYNFGGERFVYKKLQEITLSEDAQKVLDKAKELVRLSFPYRELYNENNPNDFIYTWDAGWYQINRLLKVYCPNELKEFRELYKKLGDRMRPLVYELGFLYK